MFNRKEESFCFLKPTVRLASSLRSRLQSPKLKSQTENGRAIRRWHFFINFLLPLRRFKLYLFLLIKQKLFLTLRIFLMERERHQIEWSFKEILCGSESRISLRNKKRPFVRGKAFWSFYDDDDEGPSIQSHTLCRATTTF